MCQSPDSALVSQVSIEIVAQNFYRVGVSIRNMDTSKTIYLAFGHPAEIGKGVPVFAKESWSMTVSDYSSEAIFAIASGADVPVAIQEFALTQEGV